MIGIDEMMAIRGGTLRWPNLVDSLEMKLNSFDTRKKRERFTHHYAVRRLI